MSRHGGFGDDKLRMAQDTCVIRHPLLDNSGQTLNRPTNRFSSIAKLDISPQALAV